MFAFFAVTLLITLCIDKAWMGNYPAETLTQKHCARVKNTVTFQKKTCIPDCKGGFTKDSVENCHEFKKKCPEFNQASCAWYNLTLNGVSREIPCCKLKYFAMTYTWMEVYFSHQDGDWMSQNDWTKTKENCSNQKVDDIVEIHRNIKKHADFGDRDQADWPNNVLDPNGARGLTWKFMNESRDWYVSMARNSPQICEKDANGVSDEDICTSFATILNRGHSQDNAGFEVKSIPMPSDDEATLNATVSYYHEGQCRDILLNGSVKWACGVQWTRKTTYEDKVCEYTFLEADVYSLSARYPDIRELRYAYWNMEDKNVRQQISCRKRTKDDENNNNDNVPEAQEYGPDPNKIKA